MFNKATKKKSKLRLLLDGASGSGKTWGALLIASELGKRIAFIDTEKGSASLYSDSFDFDVLDLRPPYEPEKFIEAIKNAEEDYDVLVIDSITHEWSGTGGCLDIHSKMTGNSYTNWSKVTPRHNKFVEAILQSPLHIVATARSKSDYVIEENSRGKVAPVKIGTKTEQRDGMDFEFTTVLRLNQNHMFTATKDRTSLFDSKEALLTNEHGKLLLNWLNGGVDPIVEAEKQLKSAESIEELSMAWSPLGSRVKNELKDLKDELKNTLLDEQAKHEEAA